MFPDRLMLAGISPIFNDGDSNIKKNYRTVSVLNTNSKLF